MAADGSARACGGGDGSPWRRWKKTIEVEEDGGSHQS
jgi:hypothetical protein